MSLTCEWFVLCERLIHDAHTQKTSLVDVLEVVPAFQFPAVHAGFACAARFRWNGEAPTAERQVRYRVVRQSDHAPDEIVAELTGTWKVGSVRGRVGTQFGVLRLKQAETLRFRIDHALGDGHWVEGPTCYLDVVHVPLTNEQRAELTAAGLLRDDADGP
jgi:hypothetical protein